MKRDLSIASWVVGSFILAVVLWGAFSYASYREKSRCFTAEMMEAFLSDYLPGESCVIGRSERIYFQGRYADITFIQGNEMRVVSGDLRGTLRLSYTEGKLTMRSYTYTSDEYSNASSGVIISYE